MFTGLVDDVGVVELAADGAAGRQLRIACRYEDLVPGESIAVSGVCLTVRESGPRWFEAAAVGATLGRTIIGSWRPGTRVNLERALRVGDRLGGHLVQGHVDAVGIVRRAERLGDARHVDVEVGAELAPLAVLHGSIAVDGVSLTVHALPADGLVQVAVIEYTERHTTLGALAPGDRVHLEMDIVGRYVRSLLEPWQRGLAGRPGAP